MEPYKTTMSIIVKYYEEEGELPLYNTYFWNEEKKWVIEVPQVN